MHDFYGMTEKFDAMTPNLLKEVLKFRTAFIQEELTELQTAESAEDVVDALVDICVVAIGTLCAFNVNGQRAWDEILRANMSKRSGVKPERPNPLGLPDLIKPPGWVPPSHEGNHGTLSLVFPPKSPCEL